MVPATSANHLPRAAAIGPHRAAERVQIHLLFPATGPVSLLLCGGIVFAVFNEYSLKKRRSRIGKVHIFHSSAVGTICALSALRMQG